MKLEIKSGYTLSKKTWYAIGIVIVLIIGEIFMNFGGTASNKTVHKGTAVPTAKQEQQKSANNESTIVATVSTDDALLQNPFVDIAAIKTGQAPAINGGAVTPQSARNSVLPAIPMMPRPSLPMPGNNSIPVPAIPSGGQPALKTASVQGILTGDNGQNMAIMSDGKVVSEGDVYNEGRIAYIGGDGIKFDDGHSIGYK